MENGNHDIISLEPDSIWERVYTVNPLVIVGTKDSDGSTNFAPKHMAIPMGWGAYFGFVCTPRHTTYRIISEQECFTVTYPKADQIVVSSLTASPRRADDTKPELEAMDRFPATRINASFLAEGYLYLECRLDRIIDGFGENSLIVGRIVEAHADSGYIREPSRDDNEMIYHNPLLAYLYPGRYGVIRDSRSFPFPENFSK